MMSDMDIGMYTCVTADASADVLLWCFDRCLNFAMCCCFLLCPPLSSSSSVIYGVEKRVINVLASAHEREKIVAGSHVTLDVEPTDEPNQQAQVIIREVKQPNKEEHTRKKFLGVF